LKADQVINKQYNTTAINIFAQILNLPTDDTSPQDLLANIQQNSPH